MVDTCSLSARQDWALEQLEEWYLFPDKLDTNVAKSAHSTLQSYIDAVVAPARNEGIDRNFTYVTSIDEENEFIESGSTADYGWNPVLYSDDSLFIREVYEESPSYGRGLRRGTQILELGLAADQLRTPAEIIAQDGIQALADMIFPSGDGVSVFLWVEEDDPNFGGRRNRSIELVSAEYELQPMSPFYGVKIFNRVGYINLRTFFSETAKDDLRAAFAFLNSASIERLIIDLRYNGGGLVDVAEYMGDLLGEGRAGEVFSKTVFRSNKSANDTVENFEPRAESLAPIRISFITTGSTASASELVANSMAAYLGTNAALVGRDTFGKPVGQIALDRSACDDRLRIVAFKTTNADDYGDYFNGLAADYPKTCSSQDNIFYPLGNRGDESTNLAYIFANDQLGSCVAIAGTIGTRSVTEQRLYPTNPSIGARVAMGQL